MKKLTLTIALIGIVSVAAKAQSKTSDGDISKLSTGSNFTIKQLISLKPMSYVFIGGSLGKPALSIRGFKNGESNFNDNDILVLEMSKKNFRWLNDSTAILIKP